MTDDLNIWLDGAPVIPMPGGSHFAIWLDGAPVVLPGRDNPEIFVTGSECVTETGTVVATAGGIAFVTGSECLTETGTVTPSLQKPITGSECLTETGACTAAGLLSVLVTGVECLTETGTTTATAQNPPNPPTFGGYAVFHRQTKKHRVHKFPKSRKVPKKQYRRRKIDESETVLEVDLPSAPGILKAFETSIVVARVQGLECRTSTGICNVKVDHPDDLETIKLILEVMEIENMMPDEEHAIGKTDTVSTDEEDLELILMLSEEF